MVYSTNQKHCYNLETNDMMARNYSWVMTDELSRWFEACSEPNCSSDNANFGINICTSCDNRHCNVGNRYHYWQLDFNISTISPMSGVKNVSLGKPLDCSMDCGNMDCSLGCSMRP